MAVSWVAVSRRSAIFARMRVMGTRFSTRSLDGPSVAPGSLTTGAGADGFLAGVAVSRVFMYLTISSLVMRPFLPLPDTWLISRLCSSTSCRAAGPSKAAISASSPATTGAAAAVSGAAADVAAPGSSMASNCSLSIVSPSSTWILVITPFWGATTSITTLSVSISTMSSSRETVSPSALCQAATSPSAIDSGKAGALISIAISFPL